MCLRSHWLFQGSGVVGASGVGGGEAEGAVLFPPTSCTK